MNGGDNEITQTQQSNQETVPDFDFDNASRQMLQPFKQFKFPFQRRARSLSLPKDEEGNDITEETQGLSKPIENEQSYQSRQNFQIASNSQLKKSPVGRQEQSNNRPIIAKDNFVLAHKNAIPGIQKLLKKQIDAEIMQG